MVHKKITGGSIRIDRHIGIDIGSIRSGRLIGGIDDIPIQIDSIPQIVGLAFIIEFFMIPATRSIHSIDDFITDIRGIEIDGLQQTDISGQISFIHPDGRTITKTIIINPLSPNFPPAATSNIKEALGAPALAGDRI